MLPQSLAGELRLHALSPEAALALAPLVVLAVALVVYCLVDIVRSPRVRVLPKPVWALIVILGNVPLGPLAYLIWGRMRDDSSTAGLDADEIAELSAAAHRHDRAGD